MLNKSSGWSLFYFLLALAVDVSHERQCGDIEGSGCTCTHITSDVTAAVSCANLTEVPESLGLRVGSLNLNGNRITHVDLAFLKSYPDLKSLGLRSNGVRALSKKSQKDFKPLYNLTHLDLSRVCFLNTILGKCLPKNEKECFSSLL